MEDKKQRINSIADSLKVQHDDVNVYNFHSFINLAEMTFKYLDQEFYGKIGLDRTKIQILNLLVVKGGTLTPSQLSLSVNRKKITITTALNSLEKQGLIKSSRVKKDRRLRLVTITEKGLDIMDKFPPLLGEIFAQAMSCFNPIEATTFQSFINRFRENLLRLSDGSEIGDNLRRYYYHSFLNQVTKDNIIKKWK
jgi:DNA-binding MarR family transcriptional regulator